MFRFTSRVCHREKSFDFVIRRISTKPDVIKRIMKEQKADFGALLETKKEKIQRMKREKKGISIVKTTESNEDSEFSWISKISDSRLRRVKFNHNKSPEIPVLHKKIVTKSTEMQQKTSLDESSWAPTLIMGKNSSKIETIKENNIAPLIRYSKLSQVQIRIIRKTYRSEAPTKSLPEFVISMDNTSKTKKESCHEIKIHKTRRSKWAIKVPETARGENLIEKQIKKGEQAAVEKKTLTSSKVLDKNHKTTEMEIQSKALLLPEVQLENIDKAMFFHREEDDCANLWHSSKILSISTTESKESLMFPSVTRILNVTMSDKNRKALELWMARMIANLGHEGFDEYKRDLLVSGKLLHSSIDKALRKTPFEVPESIGPCFNSLQSVLDEIKHVKAIESHVVHRDLGYRGVLDCVASYRGNLCLIDWKKSDKPKVMLSDTYDAPLQIASYIGALNADKNYPFQIKSGLLVVAYTTGNPPTVYELNEARLQHYWTLWLNRLKKYYAMQNT